MGSRWKFVEVGDVRAVTSVVDGRSIEPHSERSAWCEVGDGTFCFHLLNRDAMIKKWKWAVD